MKRVLLTGITILIGLVLSGCEYTCYDEVVYQEPARVVHVVEYRRHHSPRPMRHYQRPVARPRHQRPVARPRHRR